MPAHLVGILERTKSHLVGTLERKTQAIADFSVSTPASLVCFNQHEKIEVNLITAEISIEKVEGLVDFFFFEVWRIFVFAKNFFWCLANIRIRDFFFFRFGEYSYLRIS